MARVVGRNLGICARKLGIYVNSVYGRDNASVAKWQRLRKICEGQVSRFLNCSLVYSQMAFESKPMALLGCKNRSPYTNDTLTKWSYLSLFSWKKSRVRVKKLLYLKRAASHNHSNF